MYKVRNWHLVCLIARLQNHSLRLFITEQQTIKLMNEAISVSRRIRYRVLLEKSIPFIGVRIYEPCYTPKLNSQKHHKNTFIQVVT